MVDNQIQRNLGIDARRVAAQVASGLAHHGEVDEHGDAREVLQKNAGGHVFDFAALLACKARRNDALCENASGLVVRCIAQDVFKQDAQRERKAVGAFHREHGIILKSAASRIENRSAISHEEPPS